jgi:hypothetical protein
MKNAVHTSALLMLLVTADVTHPDGTDNTPGLYQKAFLIPRSYVETLPAPVQPDIQHSSAFSYEDLVTVTDDIVLKTDKTAIEMYCTLEEGELKSMMQGSIDGKTFALELDLFFPGSKKQIMGLVSWLKNNHFYAVVQDADENKYLVGHEVAPLIFEKYEWTTGKKGDDRKGATITFKCPKAKRPILYFEGDINQSGSGLAATEDLEFVP